MNNINNADLERIVNYLKENYKTYYEWSYNNSAVCEKYGLTNKEFLEIVSFELNNNRAVTLAWKEVLSTVVGLKDGIERTSITEFYGENCFTKDDIYEATMYASHTFSKHVIKNSHRDVIAYRFALHKQLCRTCETPEENERIAQVLSYIGLPDDNAIYFFLSNPGFTLEDASIELNKSVEEIEREFSQVNTMLVNRQHVLFDQKVIEADNPNREAITQNIFCIIKQIPSKGNNSFITIHIQIVVVHRLLLNFCVNSKSSVLYFNPSNHAIFCFFWVIRLFLSFLKRPDVLYQLLFQI